MKLSLSVFWKTISVFSFALLYSTAGLAEDSQSPDRQEEKKFAELTTGGEYRIYAFLDIEDNNPYENTSALYGRLDLENTVTFPGEDISLYFSFRADGKRTADGIRDEDTDVLLNECYVEFDKEGYSYRVGRQYVNWGKLDDFVILDRMSPQDYELFVLLDKQERKAPALMFKLDWGADDCRVQGIYIPVFKPSRVRFFGSDWALFGHLPEGIERGGYSEATKAAVRGIRIEEKDRFTEKTFKNGQAGIRFLGRAADIDYDLYYMYIHNRIPTLREKTPGGNTLKKFLYLPSTENLNAWVNSNPANDDFVLEQEHERTHVIGMDFETVLGAYGLRGELGAFLELPYLRSDFSYVAMDTLSLGIGVDHTTDGNIYYNLQFIEDFIFDYEPLFAREEYTHTVTANVNADFLRGRLLPELDAAYNISRGDWMLNPVLTYKFDCGINVSLGGFVFGGDSTTVFGRFSDKDLAYLKVSSKF